MLRNSYVGCFDAALGFSINRMLFFGGAVELPTV